MPALGTLQLKIDEVRKSQPLAWPFIVSDLEETILEAKLAFALSIQAIWERQLRTYLSGCAQELMPEKVEKVASADWRKLQKLFLAIRQIRISEFPSFGTLDTLQQLGNACRHGDGPSADELCRRCPDLWDFSADVMPTGEVGQSFSSVANMNIPIAKLREFVCAIESFWRDVEYIYNESISTKHSSLEAQLLRQRSERVWLPIAKATIE